MNVSAITSIGAKMDPAVESAHVARTAGFNAATVRNASPAEQRTAVAAQFEAILVRQMLGKTMNSMLGGSEGGVAGNVYGDMLTDTLSQQLAAGPGLGLSRFIEQQFTPRGEKAVPSPDARPANSAASIRPLPSAPTHS
jgi:Rod binding domain-containing protein